MTTDPMTRARSGDGEAFRELTEPYRRELQLHCYRMLGSLAGRRGRPAGHAAGRVAGARHVRGARLDPHLALSDRHQPVSQRASLGQPTAGEGVGRSEVQPPEPTRLGEVAWLEPYPDVLLEGAMATRLGPEARYAQLEAISLAFVTSLQLLPARQRAVLILRDVLGYQASEVAGMLDSSIDSINSALKRARAGVRHQLPNGDREPAPARNSPTEQAVAAAFVRAWESADLDALVALLTTDVGVSMPPIPFEYHGREPVARFCATIFDPPIARPRSDAGEWSAGLRRLPSCSRRRHPARVRPVRPHAVRRSHLGHDSLREQRAPVVRAACVAPRVIVQVVDCP